MLKSEIEEALNMAGRKLADSNEKLEARNHKIVLLDSKMVTLESRISVMTGKTYEAKTALKCLAEVVYPDLKLSKKPSTSYSYNEDGTEYQPNKQERILQHLYSILE